jgi:predicted NBD/HSP70 family sugar kinase
MSESIIETRKYYKRNKILNLIRTCGRLSRYDIKKMTSYSMATVLGVIDELLEKGYLYEEESSDGHVGRKPTWLRINPEFGSFIGVEFNATRMNCAMLGFCDNVMGSASRVIDPGDSSEDVLEKLAGLIEEVLRAHRPNQLFGIGIGLPGYYDSERGVGLEYAFIKAWRNVPVKAFIEARFQCPCYVENNVTAMAIGYKHRKLPPGYTDDFLFVSIRNGVRLVPVINNELFLSNKGYAGQLGHTKVYGSNRLCTCGRRGCLNAEVSDVGLRVKLIEAALAGGMPALLARVGGDYTRIGVGAFVDLALEGDPSALRLLGETAEYLGQSLGVILDILAPRHIVLYGELIRAGDAFMGPLRSALERNAIPDNFEHLTVIPCECDESMGAYGAAALVINRQFEFLKETI